MTTEVSTSTITVRPRELSFPDQVLDIGIDEATPKDIVDWLVNDGTISRTSPRGEALPPYRLSLGATFLADDVPLAKGGVRPGDILALHGGMEKG